MAVLRITCDNFVIDEIVSPFDNLPPNALKKYLDDWYKNRNPKKETPINYYKIKEIKK